MSAQPAQGRRGLLASMAAQVAAYVLEPIEETVGAGPVALEPFPVVAVVSAARRSGATSVARMLGAELALRYDAAAVLVSDRPRRPAPPSRRAVRLATAMVGAADVRAVGRLCIATGGAEREVVARAARYLAPVVIDVPPDGSAPSVAQAADQLVVVASAAQEPALLDAVALVLGRPAIKVANRVVEPLAWEPRVDLCIPDARLGVRASALGTRSSGPLGRAIADLADLIEK